MDKTAVILLNLGGPDSLEALKPFIFNLFYDKAIISLPNPLRYFLAKLISSRREKTAQKIYRFIGGKSPILEETKSQKEALESVLNKKGGREYKVFICMRHWHPKAEETILQVADYDPDEVILLPLYPQFSYTKTGSSIEDWQKTAQKSGFDKPTKIIKCYYDDNNFIDSHVDKIKETIKSKVNYKILFSAHGLPQKNIDRGDPYQDQIEKTVRKIVEKLDIEDLDYVVCYQSKVGPMKWIGPSTEEEIIRACKKEKNIVIVPIAFVSEQSETLVELDIEYEELAQKNNVMLYIRVPTLSSDKKFINALADICIK